jgi:hypothetical protein
MKINIFRWQQYNSNPGWFYTVLSAQSGSWPNFNIVVDSPGSPARESGAGSFNSGVPAIADQWVEWQLWFKTYSNSITNEQPTGWTGDGSTPNFSGQLAHDGPATNSVKVFVGGVQVGADNGNGAIIGATLTGSTINNKYGNIVVKFTAGNAPGVGVPITVSYNYPTSYAKFWLDGNLVVSNGPRSDMGSADPLSQQQWQGQIAYIQDVGNIPDTMYLDDIEAADGFVDP